MGEFNAQAIQELVGLGKVIGDPKIIEAGNIPFAVIPNDCKVESLERYVFNEHSERPERIKQTVTVLDPESFIEYYGLFAGSTSRTFADEQQARVLSVLDYHYTASGNFIPRWGQHRVTLQLRQSDEWKSWLAKNNKQFTQTEFAEFLEQNAIDITSPDPATMMEVARDLIAHTEVDFAAGVRGTDGQVRFKYTETRTASVGSGQVAVPEQFIIAIPAFIGGARIPMQALLRYRVKESKLVIWYTLVRPEEVARNAFLAARDAIARDLQITIINGAPQ